jgi:toxin ParE1/3/4
LKQSGALIQLEDLEDYIALDSEVAARKVVAKILKATSKLQSNPHISQVEELLKGREFEYHYWVVDNHKLIYRIENKTVYIIAVFDTRRNPSKMGEEVR